jgi:hypothetical protein
MPLKESKGELRDLLPTNTVTPLAFTNMFQHLEWRSLQDRRKDSRLNMFYKIVNNKVEIQPIQSKLTRVSDGLTRDLYACSFMDTELMFKFLFRRAENIVGLLSYVVYM